MFCAVQFLIQSNVIYIYDQKAWLLLAFCCTTGLIKKESSYCIQCNRMALCKIETLPFHINTTMQHFMKEVSNVKLQCIKYHRNVNYNHEVDLFGFQCLKCYWVSVRLCRYPCVYWDRWLHCDAFPVQAFPEACFTLISNSEIASCLLCICNYDLYTAFI